MNEAFHFKRKVSLGTYINQQIRMLKDEFLITLDDGDILQLRGSKSEYEVNDYVRKIIVNRL